MRQDETVSPRTERSHSDVCCGQRSKDSRGMLACKIARSSTVPQFRKCDTKKWHTRKRFTLSGHYTLRSFCILCVCVQLRTLVLPVCVLLIAFSAMSRALLVLSPGGTEGSVGADVSVEIQFATTMHLYEKEKFASLSSSLWLHAVLCALCFLPKV